MSEDSESTFGCLFTSGGIVFIGLVFNHGMGFLSRVILARVLGPGSYGGIAIGTSILTTATVFVVIVLRFGGIEPEEASLLGTFEQRFSVDLDHVRVIAKRLAG